MGSNLLLGTYAGTWRPAGNSNMLKELVGTQEKVGRAGEETGNGFGMKRKGDIFYGLVCYGLKCACSKGLSAFPDTPCVFLPFQLNRRLCIVPTTSSLSTLFVFCPAFPQTSIHSQDVYSLEQNPSFSTCLAGPIC